MLKTMANGDQSELVRVMKNTLNVLRAVDTLTALRSPIHASMLTVLTDSSLNTKKMLKSMANGDQPELVRVMTNACTLMKSTVTARTFRLNASQMSTLTANTGQSDHAYVMTNTSSLTNKHMLVRIYTAQRLVK